MGTLCEWWKGCLCQGIIFVILGLLAIALPGITTLGFELLIGWILIIGGIVHAFQSFQEKSTQDKVLSFLAALVYFFTGVLLLTYPLTGVLTLTFLFVLFLAIEGIVKVVRSFQAYSGTNRGWMLLSGLIALLLAGLIWSGWPSTALWFLGLLIGINLLFYGASLIAIGCACRCDSKTDVEE